MTDLIHGWQDAHALSGAYAVDALDAEERARFEEHLVNCAHCRDEVDGLREASALLGADSDVAPPPSVRDAVLSGITGIRPLPPLTPAAPAAPEGPAPTGSTVTDLSARRAHWLLRRTPLLVAAAVLLILTAGLAMWTQRGADDTPVHLTAAERVLAADDAARIEATFDDGSRATVVVSRTVGRAVILTEDMKLAPNGKVYALWLQSPAGDMVPAGLMPDDPDATVVLDGDASQATAVGITIEPDGGSPAPTTDPIAVFPLEA